MRRWCAAAAAVVSVRAAPAAHPAELVDRVLAVVSGTVITLSDVRTALALGFVDATAAADPVAAAVTQLIERRLILDEAVRVGQDEPDFVTVEAMAWAARRRFATAADWEAARRRLGFDDAGVRRMASDLLVAEQVLAGRVNAQPAPTEDELRAAFTARPDRFARDGRRRTFDDARTDVEVHVTQERRELAAREWIGRLRRRADVSELYTPIR